MASQLKVDHHAKAILQRSAGQASLSVKAGKNRSSLENLFQKGCAKIRIPKSFGVGKSGTPLEAVMINTAGGMTGGDELDWSVDAGADTSTVVTTQACERIYKSVSGASNVSVRIKIAAGSTLFWLPQETILFDQSVLKRSIEVDLADTGELLMVESIILGRKAMGEVVRETDLSDRWRITMNGKIVHAEDFKLSGNIPKLIASASVAAGNGAVATLLMISPRAHSLVEKARKCIGKSGGVSFVKTDNCPEGKLVVRLVALESYELRRTLVPLLKLLTNDAELPKSWAL